MIPRSPLFRAEAVQHYKERQSEIVELELLPSRVYAALWILLALGIAFGAAAATRIPHFEHATATVSKIGQSVDGSTRSIVSLDVSRATASSIFKAGSVWVRTRGDSHLLLGIVLRSRSDSAEDERAASLPTRNRSLTDAPNGRLEIIVTLPSAISAEWREGASFPVLVDLPTRRPPPASR